MSLADAPIHVGDAASAMEDNVGDYVHVTFADGICQTHDSSCTEQEQDNFPLTQALADIIQPNCEFMKQESEYVAAIKQFYHTHASRSEELKIINGDFVLFAAQTGSSFYCQAFPWDMVVKDALKKKESSAKRGLEQQQEDDEEPFPVDDGE